MFVWGIVLMWATGAGDLHAQENSAPETRAQTDSVLVKMGWEGYPPFPRLGRSALVLPHHHVQLQARQQNQAFVEPAKHGARPSTS